MDDHVLRTLDNQRLSAYFRNALENDQIISLDLTEHLLRSVEKETVPPRVVSTWLSVCSDPCCVAKILRSDSTAARRAAIKSIGKRLHGKDWLAQWTALGGTKGVISLLAELSAQDVKALCIAFGKTGTATNNQADRQACMSDLLKSLVPEWFSEGKYHNPETRRLLHFYRHITDACDGQTRKAWKSNKSLPGPKLDDKEKALFTFQGIFERSEANRSELFPDFQSIDLEDQKSGQYIGFSKDMLFSLQRLWLLAKHDGNEELKKDFLIEVATPLLRRMLRKQCRTKTILIVIELIQNLLVKYPDARRQLRISCTGFLSYVVRFCARKCYDDFAKLLRPLLQLIPVANTVTTANVAEMLALVRLPMRSALLRSILRDVRAFGLDLDNDADLKSYEGKWSLRVFLQLPAQEATKLLDRLSNLVGDRDFIDWSQHSSWSGSFLSLDQRADTTMLRLRVLRDNAVVLKQAQMELSKAKEEAFRSRDQGERAYWAKQAICIAIASRNYEVYAETLSWAREKYKKDPLTLQTLYTGKSINSDEGIEMICAFSRQMQPDTTVSVSARIQAGNRIALHLVETACLAIEEPGLRAQDWDWVYKLYATAVSKRLSQAGKLQQTLGIDDDTMYQTIWQSTIQTLIQIERTGLDERNSKLRWNTLTGPVALDLARSFDRSGPGPPKSSSRFLNDLAKQRNALWEQYRPKIHPAVVDLPRYLPRGLPLQCLLPNIPSCLFEQGQMQYIVERAQEILFASDEILSPIPASQELRTAVGNFLESWQEALKFFIRARPKGLERDSAILKVWNHTLRLSMAQGMTIEEARRLWFPRFRESAGSRLMKVHDYQNLLPLSWDDPKQLTEWNPDPSFSIESEEARKIEKSCLELFADQGGFFWSSYATVNSPFGTYIDAAIPSVEHHFWTKPVPGATLIARAQPNASREAIVAAAAIYFVEKLAGGPSILATPFPRAEEARYSALYLDNEFLERLDIDEVDALQALEMLLSEIPSDLLSRASLALQPVLSQPESGAKKRLIYGLVSLTCSSDQPFKFFENHLKLVLERSEDSAWHRQVLKKQMLSNMSAKRARDSIRSIADALQERFDASKPVKITTLKQFAALIGDIECIDASTAVSTLFMILTKSRHIDAQAAAIQNLVSIYSRADKTTRKLVLEGLKTHAIDIAASIDERRVISEDSWKQHESQRIAPAPSKDAISPIMEILLKFTKPSPSDLEPCNGVEIVTDVLLEIFQRSTRDIQRWTQIFLDQHGFVLPEHTLRYGINAALIRRLLEDHLWRLPVEVIEMYRSFQVEKARQYCILHKIEQEIKDSAAMRKSEQGIAFLRFWDMDDSHWRIADTLIPRLLLHHNDKETKDELREKKYDLLQHFVFDTAQSLIDKGDHDIQTQLERYLGPLSPHGYVSRADRSSSLPQHWQQHVRPVLDKIRDHIQCLRTPAWQVDINRKPAFLPNTYFLDLWLLSYPHESPELSNDGRTFQCQTFAVELSHIVTDLTVNGKNFADRLRALESASRQVISDRHLRIALVLGEAANDMNRSELDRFHHIGLSHSFLKTAVKPFNTADVARAKAMAHEWAQSLDEDVRLIGSHIVRSLDRQTFGYRRDYMWADADKDA